VSATVAQSPPANASYFLTYEMLKKYALNVTNGEYPAAVFFLAGGLSELVSSLFFVPFDVVKSRLQLGENPNRATGGIVSATKNFSSLPAAMRGIYKESGVRGLTAGWGAGLLLDMSFSGTQFLLYEQFKRMVKRKVKRDPTAMETLLCGCVSGGIAAAITNPLDVIVSRIQCQDANRGYGTKMSTVFKATVAEGPIALWRGTLPRVAQIAPLSALSFAVYETMRRYLKDTALFREA
jgi:solute carrier family 25 S-adenosylmethionine transporter 26